MLEVHPIFQTPIFVSHLPGMTDAHGLDKFIAKACDETPGRFGPGEVVQSRYNLEGEALLAPLRERIVELTLAIVREVYQYSPAYAVEITSMWGNAQKPGCAFTRHIHHNNVFSGVFFLNEDEKFPPITFWRPKETTIDPRTQAYNVFNQGSNRRQVKKDMLIIFPAWLDHSVDVNTTARDRLGISFNIMLRGAYYNNVL